MKRLLRQLVHRGTNEDGKRAPNGDVIPGPPIRPPFDLCTSGAATLGHRCAPWYQIRKGHRVIQYHVCGPRVSAHTWCTGARYRSVFVRILLLNSQGDHREHLLMGRFPEADSFRFPCLLLFRETLRFIYNENSNANPC
ncbi:hypothetical protein X777_11325 [Ooceraea biroi]|uniref:Uncharacterized protein n=1 Tax=Ooceraea biroi TaxID=2015173 RepID=A0A026W5B7_OOCBI|nr:hypothetical protein X777_11325 [Ooceraea biroi]